MFNNPLETESSYAPMKTRIWEEFKKLQSQDFSVQHASSSGHPGNVSPRLVRREVQQWIDQLDIADYYPFPPYKTFQFNNWRLDIELEPKSPEDKERLGETAVESAGFSGGWSDEPARRLKRKLKEKFSQVGKTRSHCIVAITESLRGFSVDDVQTALLGGNRDYLFDSANKIDDLYPEVKGLSIPQPNPDGLWSSQNTKEPTAVIVHMGDLLTPNVGETQLWLNPNNSYFRVPLPLFSLSVHAAEQTMWTRPATRI